MKCNNPVYHSVAATTSQSRKPAGPTQTQIIQAAAVEQRMTGIGIYPRTGIFSEPSVAKGVD